MNECCKKPVLDSDAATLAATCVDWSKEGETTRSAGLKREEGSGIEGRQVGDWFNSIPRIHSSSSSSHFLLLYAWQIKKGNRRACRGGLLPILVSIVILLVSCSVPDPVDRQGRPM